MSILETEECTEDDVLDVERTTFTKSEEMQLKIPLHIKCAAHSLSLIATTDLQEGLQRFETLQNIHNDIMTRCKTLWKAKRSFKNNEILLKELCISLKTPSVTRWNSMFDALEQIVSLQNRMDEINQKLGICDILEAEDFTYLRNYIESTGPLAKALDILQGNVPYGYIMPTLLNLRHQLLVLKDKFCDNICLPLLDSQIQGLENRFEDIFRIENSGKVAALASFFHPSFKTYWYKRIDADLQLKVNELVTTVALVEFKQCSDSQMLEDLSKNENDCDLLNFSMSQNDFNDNDVHERLKAFESDKRTDLRMLNDYPNIKNIFLKYNTPSPSSAAVERLFSYATLISLPKFNRLSDDNFELKVIYFSNAGSSRNSQ